MVDGDGNKGDWILFGLAQKPNSGKWTLKSDKPSVKSGVLQTHCCGTWPTEGEGLWAQSMLLLCASKGGVCGPVEPCEEEREVALAASDLQEMQSLLRRISEAGRRSGMPPPGVKLTASGIYLAMLWYGTKQVLRLPFPSEDAAAECRDAALILMGRADEMRRNYTPERLAELLEQHGPPVIRSLRFYGQEPKHIPDQLRPFADAHAAGAAEGDTAEVPTGVKYLDKVAKSARRKVARGVNPRPGRCQSVAEGKHRRSQAKKTQQAKLPKAGRKRKGSQGGAEQAPTKRRHGATPAEEDDAQEEDLEEDDEDDEEDLGSGSLGSDSGSEPLDDSDAASDDEFALEDSDPDQAVEKRRRRAAPAEEPGGGMTPSALPSDYEEEDAQDEDLDEDDEDDEDNPEPDGIESDSATEPLNDSDSDSDDESAPENSDQSGGGLDADGKAGQLPGLRLPASAHKTLPLYLPRSALSQLHALARDPLVVSQQETNASILARLQRLRESRLDKDAPREFQVAPKTQQGGKSSGSRRPKATPAAKGRSHASMRRSRPDVADALEGNEGDASVGRRMATRAAAAQPRNGGDPTPLPGAWRLGGSGGPTTRRRAATASPASTPSAAPPAPVPAKTAAPGDMRTEEGDAADAGNDQFNRASSAVKRDVQTRAASSTGSGHQRWPREEVLRAAAEAQARRRPATGGPASDERWRGGANSSPAADVKEGAARGADQSQLLPPPGPALAKGGATATPMSSAAPRMLGGSKATSGRQNGHQMAPGPFQPPPAATPPPAPPTQRSNTTRLTSGRLGAAGQTLQPWEPTPPAAFKRHKPSPLGSGLGAASTMLHTGAATSNKLLAPEHLADKVLKSGRSLADPDQEKADKGQPPPVLSPSRRPFSMRASADAAPQLDADGAWCSLPAPAGSAPDAAKAAPSLPASLLQPLRMRALAPACSSPPAAEGVRPGARSAAAAAASASAAAGAAADGAQAAALTEVELTPRQHYKLDVLAKMRDLHVELQATDAAGVHAVAPQAQAALEALEVLHSALCSRRSAATSHEILSSTAAQAHSSPQGKTCTEPGRGETPPDMGLLQGLDPAVQKALVRHIDKSNQQAVARYLHDAKATKVVDAALLRPRFVLMDLILVTEKEVVAFVDGLGQACEAGEQ